MSWSASRLASSIAGPIASVLLLAALAPPARAALRVPQVPVTGTALASFFTSQGQTISVSTAQQDVQRLGVPTGASFRVRLHGSAAGSFGIYNASAIAPALYQLVPAGLPGGWSVIASFRSSPDRVVVSLFDAADALQGTTTFLGADRTDFGFYYSGGGGTFYSQDLRNPGVTAQLLAYNATGALAGYLWFACEATPGAGGDYADNVALVELGFAPVPVLDAHWGALKQRFR